MGNQTPSRIPANDLVNLINGEKTDDLTIGLGNGENLVIDIRRWDNYMEVVGMLFDKSDGLVGEYEMKLDAKLPHDLRVELSLAYVGMLVDDIRKTPWKYNPCPSTDERAVE